MKFPPLIHNFILNKPLNCYLRKIVILSLIAIISSCQDSAPKTTSPESSVNNTSEPIPSPQDALATIREIQSQPVWLRRINVLSEISAQQGMGIQIGETIRTEGKAMAEINLKNGLAFRIGGNAVLTLEPDNHLKLSAGEMITWVTPGKKVPIQVITPGGIAGIRGTTIHVKMPKNPRDAIEFFTWEGTMFIRLPNKTEEFQLKAGEIVKIKPGETNINKIRASVRRLTSQEWLNRRRNSRLINKFAQPLPTLQKIDQTAPSLPKTSFLTPTYNSTKPLASSHSTPSPSPQIMPTVVINTPTPTKKITSILQDTPSKDYSSNLKPLPERTSKR